jgi:hypothetical protein
MQTLLQNITTVLLCQRMVWYPQQKLVAMWLAPGGGSA